MTHLNLFVQYQQSMDMRELGFDKPCLGLYHNDKMFVIQSTTSHNQYYGQICSAPLYQQAFSWFREKYKLHGGIHQSGDMDDRYTFRINFTCYPHNSVGRGNEYSYPEAELECLKKLILIVKQKL